MPLDMSKQNGNGSFNSGNESSKNNSQQPSTLRHRASIAQPSTSGSSLDKDTEKLVGSTEVDLSPEIDLDQNTDAVWSVCDYWNLPVWLQDNAFLLSGHRPQLHSFYACFRSIFRMHTETINIWTHLLGCFTFIILAMNFLLKLRPIEEKLVFFPFFIGAICCLGFSFIFHTVVCHSPFMVALFSRLDYCGITMLIMGSFVPWIYYLFYCFFWLKIVYLGVTMVLGTCAVVLSLLEKFSASAYRPLRAGVFTTFGLSGVIPGVHWFIIHGWDKFPLQIALLLVTAGLYMSGAFLYSFRVPERMFPGHCDIWFHSHQIFHVLVVIATLVNYGGLTVAVEYQKSIEKCF